MTDISVRKQTVSIITAGFGQNFVLTTVSTFLLLYLVQYANISTAGIAVVTASSLWRRSATPSSTRSWAASST